MEEFESRLIPILREGVDIIKMILFKKLKEHLSDKYIDRDAQFVSKLTGAIVNDLFGTPNTQEPFASFVEENLFFIKMEMKNLATELQEMRIPLTDALRVQFLCDSQEGVDSSAILVQAKELGILIVDREAPMPAKFMNLVRKLGSSYDLLIHVPIADLSA
jgi:hypothetical protein